MDNVSLDISGLLDLKRKELGSHEAPEIEFMDCALQSIYHRLEYCKYHYDEFCIFTSQQKLMADRLGCHDSDGMSIRTKYEANAMAFLHNLHALIDSWPYLLNSLYKKVDKPGQLRLGDGFLGKFKPYNFYPEMDGFFKDEMFVVLRDVGNMAKHNYLPKIRNEMSKLILMYYSKDEGEWKETELKSFIIDCHDYLVPKYLHLCNLVKISKEKELMDRPDEAGSGA